MATPKPLSEQLQKMHEKKRLFVLLDILVIEYFVKERLTARSRIPQCVYPSISFSELLSQQKVEGVTKVYEKDELSADGEVQVEYDGYQEGETEDETEEYGEKDYHVPILFSTPLVAAEPSMMAESKRKVIEYLRKIEAAEERTQKIISDLRLSDLATVDLDEVERQFSSASEPFPGDPGLNAPGRIEWRQRKKMIFEGLHLYQKNIGSIFHPFGDLPGEIRREIWRLAHHEDRVPAVIKLLLSLQSSASTISITNNRCLQNDSRILKTPAVLHVCGESRSQFLSRYSVNFDMKCGDWTPDRDVCVCCQDRLHRCPKAECFDSDRGMAKDYFWDPDRDVIHLSQSEGVFDVSWIGTRMRIAGVKRIVLEQELFFGLADNEILHGEELETIFVACEKFSIRPFPSPPCVLSYDSIVQYYLDLKSEELSKLVGNKKVIVVGDISQLEEEILLLNEGRPVATTRRWKWNFLLTR